MVQREIDSVKKDFFRKDFVFKFKNIYSADNDTVLCYSF